MPSIQSLEQTSHGRSRESSPESICICKRFRCLLAVSPEAESTSRWFSVRKQRLIDTCCAMERGKPRLKRAKSEARGRCSIDRMPPLLIQFDTIRDGSSYDITASYRGTSRPVHIENVWRED